MHFKEVEKMEMLVTVRYPLSYSLVGMKKLPTLAEKLKEKLQGKKILILSSSLVEAKNCAQAIAESLKAPLLEFNEFNVDDYYYGPDSRLRKAIDRVKGFTDNYEVIVVITQQATTSGLIEGFAYEVLGIPDLNCEEAIFSSANILNLREKSLITLFPIVNNKIFF